MLIPVIPSRCFSSPACIRLSIQLYHFEPIHIKSINPSYDQILFNQPTSTNSHISLCGGANDIRSRKQNIMKLGDGLFLNTCREIAQEYKSSGIAFNDMIVDNW